MITEEQKGVWSQLLASKLEGNNISEYKYQQKLPCGFYGQAYLAKLQPVF